MTLSLTDTFLPPFELDAEQNRVIVGDDSALAFDEFSAARCNWIAFATRPAAFDATVKIR
jgi:tRNA U34 2-thiouridine synthase MnmA/TrmU